MFQVSHSGKEKEKSSEKRKHKLNILRENNTLFKQNDYNQNRPRRLVSNRLRKLRSRNFATTYLFLS